MNKRERRQKALEKARKFKEELPSFKRLLAELSAFSAMFVACYFAYNAQIHWMGTLPYTLIAIFAILGAIRPIIGILAHASIELLEYRAKKSETQSSLD